jgi:hypothetical protein
VDKENCRLCRDDAVFELLLRLGFAARVSERSGARLCVRCVARRPHAHGAAQFGAGPGRGNLRANNSGRPYKIGYIVGRLCGLLVFGLALWKSNPASVH